MKTNLPKSNPQQTVNGFAYVFLINQPVLGQQGMERARKASRGRGTDRGLAGIIGALQLAADPARVQESGIE